MHLRTALIALSTVIFAIGCLPGERAGTPSDNDPGGDDDRCAEITPIWAAGASPAAVSLHFEVRDCDDGQPLGALDVDRFGIVEGGEAVGLDAGVRRLTNRRARPYLTVMVDTAGQSTDDIDMLQEGLRALVDRLFVDDPIADVHVGIQVFDDSDETTALWQPPIDDAVTLHERIAQLDQVTVDETAGDVDDRLVATNAAVRAHLQQVADRNDGGVIPVGHTIAVTAGDIGDAAQLADAIADGRSGDGVDGPGVHTRAVVIDTDASSFATALGGERWVESTSLDELSDALANAADGVTTDIDAIDRIAYCSTLRDADGADTVKLRLDDFGADPVEFTIDASGFEEGCDLAAVDADCDLRECGGFHCGGCSDTAEICDGDAGECVYYCIDQVVCEDRDITTDLGHEMNCFMGPGVTECDNQCVDVSVDDRHCGDCGVECTAPGSECVDGRCLCDDGTADCDGTCIDITDDDDNCGDCGHACPEGIDCVDGQCLCGDGQIACGGECVDTDTSDDHCGTCSNPCGDGEQCTQGVCICDSGLYRCDGSCVDIFTDTDHCGGCSNACTPDQICDNASCVCAGDDEQNCGGVCLDITGDDDNCGGCDISCAAEQHCDDGDCVCDDADLTACGDDCVDTDTDDDHCGGCNTGCATTETCDGGACVWADVLDDRQITAGIDHSCAIDTDGTAICWGRDDHGQASPLNLQYTDIAPGDRHTCAIDVDDDAICWGLSMSGETTVPAGASFVAIATGWNHTCAIETDDSANCWGSDQDGKSTPPTGSFDQIDVGFAHSCGLKTDGTIECWGDGDDGKTSPPSGQFQTISVGRDHACAIDTDDEIDCWGRDGSGRTSGPTGAFDDVAAGGAHSCAIDTSGDIDCWGSDTSGQGDSNAPSGTFQSISAGFQYTCAVDTAGDVHCWGDDDDGQSGFPGW